MSVYSQILQLERLHACMAVYLSMPISSAILCIRISAHNSRLTISTCPGQSFPYGGNVIYTAVRGTLAHLHADVPSLFLQQFCPSVFTVVRCCCCLAQACMCETEGTHHKHMVTFLFYKKVTLEKSRDKPSDNLSVRNGSYWELNEVAQGLYLCNILHNPAHTLFLGALLK